MRAHACLRREFRPTGPHPSHWFEPCTAETTRVVLLPGAQHAIPCPHAIPCQLATRDTTRQVPLQNCTRNVTRRMRRAPQKNTFTLCFAALRRRTESGACRPTVQRGTTRWNPTRVAHRADTGTCTSAHNALAHADEDATAGLRQQGHARVPPLTFYPTLRFGTASRTVSCAATPPPIRDS